MKRSIALKSTEWLSTSYKKLKYLYSAIVIFSWRILIPTVIFFFSESFILKLQNIGSKLMINEFYHNYQVLGYIWKSNLAYDMETMMFSIQTTFNYFTILYSTTTKKICNSNQHNSMYYQTISCKLRQDTIIAQKFPILRKTKTHFESITKVQFFLL